MVSGYSYKYPKLNDRDFLYKEYITKQKSTIEICKKVGCKTCNSVRQALIRFNIPVRNCSTGFTINNPIITINQQLIDGCLLGDAHLAKYNIYSNLSTAKFQKKNIHYNHVLLIAKSFYSPKLAKQRVKKYTGIQQTGKIHSHYYFSTYAEFIFNKYFDRWYPKRNNYKKVIPDDIIIDKELLLHWFLDDGTSSWRTRNNKKTDQVILHFCTDCFIKEQQEVLCDKINSVFDLNIKIYPYMKTWRIKIPQKNTNMFFDIIGPSPVKELEYKWKIR